MKTCCFSLSLIYSTYSCTDSWEVKCYSSEGKGSREIRTQGITQSHSTQQNFLKRLEKDTRVWLLVLGREVAKNRIGGSHYIGFLGKGVLSRVSRDLWDSVAWSWDKLEHGWDCVTLIFFSWRIDIVHVHLEGAEIDHHGLSE